MNLSLRARQFDSAITALFPGWAAKRSSARLSAAQNSYLAAAYDASRQTQQRKPRSTIAMSESGSVTDLDLDSMREWSRDSYRNNSIFSGICRRAVDNIVGDELVVQPLSSDAGWNAEVKESFTLFTRRAGGWEASGRWSLGQFQRSGLLSVWREGDFIMYRSGDGWQFFEGAQIGTPTGYDRAACEICNGIEFPTGSTRPAYYWVSKYSKLGYIDGRTALGLRADHCRHVVNFEWLSQNRGVPLFANSLARMEDFDRYLEAELLGAMAAACVVGEINSPHRNAGAALDVTPIGQQSKDADRPKPRQLSPAMIIETWMNEKFTMHSPNRPSGAFGEYFRGNIRLFGMPVGMPLELTFMDFSQTNFAAAKMAVMQSGKTQSFWRKDVVGGQITSPVYVDFVTNVFRAKGRPADFLKHELIPPEQDWIQPEQETNAINSAIEGGWDSRTRATREEMRRNFTDVMRENAQEIVDAMQICKDRGLDPEKYWREVRGQMQAAKAAAETFPAAGADVPKAPAK